jgi:hypothetical protein
VVYRPDRDTNTTSRVLVRGPAMHVPQPDEWTHTFEWHGSNRNHQGQMIKKGRRFEKLRVIPTQV